MIGQTISHYLVMEQIGAGGMGVVYRARDERLERDVALKVLTPALVGDQEFLARFRREARLLSKINHPNIATVHDFDTVDGITFLVMEFIKGETLSHKVKDGPLQEREILRLGTQLLQGLQAAHAEGIIHRDLKPGNLRETQDRLLKILDFGLARVVHSDVEATQSTLATSGAVGTLPYMSPEQLQGLSLDARTDIYSTGVVLYELATGQRPFTEVLGSRLIDSILHRKPASPREVNPEISQDLEAVILKCIEKAPQQRYSSARDMCNVLMGLTGNNTAPRQPETRQHPQAPPMEIAHVLCADVVGYSQLPMDEQQRLLRTLQDVVRQTSEFVRARAHDQLISLPAGDGMALVFFGEPESAPRCALELSQKLKEHPEIQLRIGINSGPVYRVADINANRNVAGGGINIAQRVMDCGDIGHILVSKTVADVLTQLSTWHGRLHDLGAVEVKHDAFVHIYNLLTETVGNPAVPEKIKTQRKSTRTKGRPLSRSAWIVMALLAALAVGVMAWTLGGRRLAKRSFRPTIAVLGFKNQTATPESDWVSTSLSDMLASELAAGDLLVPTPAESVARLKMDMALPNESSYAPAIIKRVHDSLSCDYVVYGGFFDPGKAGGGQVRLDLRLQNATNGEVLTVLHETGTELTLPDLASAVGAALRAKLGLPGISVSQSSELQAAIPSTPDATRLYFQGLGQLRSFDLLGARDSLAQATNVDANFSLAHAYLAEAWEGLGYDEKARDEAKLAFGLSTHLGREDRTFVEARFRAISGEWDQAVNLYRSLYTLYPENPEYAYRATDVQIRAGKANDALQLIDQLGKRPGPMNDDPRLDLKEAEALESLSDFAKEKQIATRAADNSRAKGFRLLEAEALWRSCAAMASLGEASGAQAACRQSVALAQPVGDLLLVARGFTILGRIAEAQGDPNQGLEQHRHALEYARKIGSRRDITGALINIANNMANQGDLAGAQKSYEEALAVAQEIKDGSQIVVLLNNMATVSQSLGKFGAALHLYQQALDEARALADKDSVSLAQINIGVIYSLQGNFGPALQSMQEALKGASETGNKTDQAQFLYALGDARLAQGDLEAAEASYQTGLKLAESLGQKSLVALGQVSLGDLRLQAGNATEAEGLARMGADEFHAEGMKDQECAARNVIAAALIDLGRGEDAGKEMQLVAKLSPQDVALKLAAAITSARLRVQSGKPRTGKDDFDDIAADAIRIGIPGLQFEARLAKAEADWFRGDQRSAVSLLSTLERDAAKKGFKQFQLRAKELATRIAAPRPA